MSAGPVMRPVVVGQMGAGRKRPSLANVTSKTKATPPRIIIHGAGGIGKSSLAAQFPRSLWIQTPGETGLETLVSAGQVPARPIFQFEEPVVDASGKPVSGQTKLTTQVPSWPDLMGALDTLLIDDHEYQTLVVDVIDGVERLCHEHVCGVEYGGDWGEKGFASYQKGYDVSLTYLKEFTIKVDRLRTEKSMYFVGLCHTRIKTFQNPTGADYDRWEPTLHKKTWEMLFGWSDIVLFMNQEVFSDAKRKATKGKAATGERYMYTTQTASWDAKHRHGIPDQIPMGSNGSQAFEALCSAMKKAKEEGIASRNSVGSAADAKTDKPQSESAAVSV